MNDTRHFPAAYGKGEFHCPHCGVYSKQRWSFIHAQGQRNYNGSAIIPDVTYFAESLPEIYALSKCEHCNALCLWHEKKLIFPHVTVVEQPNEDLSESIRELYNEAATILNDSPRAAAALLRLALQLLLKELGGAGKNINDDIATIVKGGVDSQVQKALDVVRVFGNNAAHPGEINLQEKSELVMQMFQLINFIANKMITQKKELDHMFDSLPDTVKQQIAKRDEKEADNG